MFTQHRVFVVDDEEIIASTLAMILRGSGFDVTPFTNPLKVLEATYSDIPDLLLTDVVMPEMDGIQLAIQVQQVRPGCKVLLFSGQAGTQDLLEAAKAAGHDFELLCKPVHPRDLIRKIEADLGRPARAS